MAHHHLAASAAHCHWGFFDAALPALLTVQSGDTVTIDTLTGPPEMVPPAPFYTPPSCSTCTASASASREAPHILTGPVAVEGAMPGDVLEVRIKAVELRQDWGFNLVRPARRHPARTISRKGASSTSRSTGKP